MRSIIILLLLMVQGIVGTAQNLSIQNDNLVWLVDELEDTDATDTTMAFSCKFETHGLDKVVWLQNNDAYGNEFLVQSVSGEWDDPSQPGSIRYQVTCGDMAGSIRIARSGSLTTIVTDFRKNGANIMPYTFHVAHVTAKP